MTAHRVLAWIIVALLFSGVGAAVAPSVADAQVVGKECGSCGRPVSVSSQVGGSCPHCGAKWGYERTKTNDGGGATYRSRPLTPWEIRARQEAYARYRRHQKNLAKAERIRAYKEARREHVWALARQETEEFRRTDDPEERAQRYLDAGVRSEDAGQIEFAVYQYRMVVRSLPHTEAAIRAEYALDRLGASKPLPRPADPIAIASSP